MRVTVFLCGTFSTVALLHSAECSIIMSECSIIKCNITYVLYIPYRYYSTTRTGTRVCGVIRQ